jgi:hypothetical protein
MVCLKIMPRRSIHLWPPVRLACGRAPLLLLIAGAVACSAATSPGSDIGPWISNAAAGSGGASGTGAVSVDAGPVRDSSTVVITTSKSDAAVSGNCKDPSDQDYDGDGYTSFEGDCDDCSAIINPGAFDFPDDDIDDDCNGTAATAIEACETNLKIDSTDPKDGARAIGLCTFTDEKAKGWGVLSARYTDASGKGKITDPLAVGIAPDFGAAKPKAGVSMLVLSTGVARAVEQRGYTEDCDTFDAVCPLFALGGCTSGNADPPAGYPKENSVCKDKTGFIFQKTQIFNQAAFELQIRAPRNANSFSFDSIFYTYEYPKYICDEYNDFFVVFKSPKPKNVTDGNIVFDKNGDPIGVNTGLLAVCDSSLQAADAPKRFACEQGTDLLKGTGFGAGETSCYEAGGASTGWLHTQAPIEPGEVITLRFAVWDTNDPILDSTALIDHFTWGRSEKPVEVETIPLM